MSTRFYRLDKVATSRDNSAVDWFHCDMFHGGETLPFRNADPRVLPPPRPVRLWKNVYEIGDVFKPQTACALVVSDRVRQALVDLPGLSFLPVEFARAFHYPYRASDFSYRKTWPKWQDAERFIQDHPHDPTSLQNMGEYFELVVPRAVDVAAGYDDLRRVDMPVGPERHESPVDVDVSEALLRDHPITWRRGHIFSEAAFRRIERFLDWHYFLVCEYKVS